MQPVAFHLGPAAVNWYATMLALGFALALVSACWRAPLTGVSARYIADIFPLAILASLLGAQLWHVVTNWEEQYSGASWREWFAFQRGGLVYYGGLFGAMAVVIFYARWRRCSFWKLADAIAPNVALSATNLVVGTLEYYPTNQNRGSGFVFSRNGTNWFRQQRLQPADGVPDDQFGAAVAMDGETILVGAPLRDEGGTNAGAAYVFVREGGAWIQQAKLLATLPLTNAFFGGAVALSGDTAFITAPQGTGLSAENRPGEVHVFVRSGSTWAFHQKLTSPGQFPRDLFGASLAVREDTLVIGAPGIVPTGPPPDSNFGKRAAYVFARNGNDWIEQQRLTSADLAPFDIFATSVGVAEDYVVVGAPHSWPFSATPRDAAYGFQRSGTQWRQSLRMTPTPLQLIGAFGFALAADGATLAVGAPAHTNSTVMRGSVFLFELPPVLHLAHDGSDAILTWSVTAAGYVLHTTTNLTTPDSWQPVSPAPVGNTHRTLIEESARFYRLQRK